MSRIRKAFEKGKAFIPFITAGDPSLEKTEEFIFEMERAGADLIEIGIPFSDPIAEGIAHSGGGTSARWLPARPRTRYFTWWRESGKRPRYRWVFMTYLNPVFHYGYEKVLQPLPGAGIDGIIIPDLPFEEKGELEGIAAAHGVELISMIAPTSRQRIQAIAREAKGFIYVVSSMGVTGMRREIPDRSGGNSG